jgi:hypothetical protein
MHPDSVSPASAFSSQYKLPTCIGGRRPTSTSFCAKALGLMIPRSLLLRADQSSNEPTAVKAARLLSYLPPTTPSSRSRAS